ncbi:two-partner secretion domain-containing protein [Pseudomonas mosselii]|uniref:Filamentous hemagglutinin N-terminal domain-containing protein n=1 Tax=Pseudomonas mosselii TaxID=78327 RepID=A0A7W2JXE3_9PSED|nr:filamentous hemagglutinin N-terminal domain-containing protein [Pseudomonas mosselii]MBA6066761.1 filamentous hemagglutinin N-terminal domain-containing protein [Pseudomonas mosselii]
MDVRLFAFLARQRSAEIQPREHFCGLPKRGLAFLLANAMFWQPLWAQAAEGVVVSGPGTSLGQAGNGVPIVNIAAPNGSGLSHNQFSDYNVGQQGLILNNATERTQATQLGGIILGNPNLQGAAANVILNEVNGANASQLRGYTEVAGHAAKVIVANPHGITCDGCGFINTPQVTLSTGKPVLDGRGAVSGYQVDGGSVALEGAGLNADNVERFDIITRSARLNAQLRARELNVITGRNDVDAQTLAAAPRAGNAADAPALAIDSSALGGMYAGAIRLVGTEAGVGVRLAGDVAASGGDIRLDANGQLSLAQASASGAVKLQAAGVDLQGPVHGASQVEVRSSADLTSRQAITAGNRISVQATGTLANQGVIEAGVNADGSRNAQGDVSIASGQLLNSGKSIVASRDLDLAVQGQLVNRSGTLSAGQDSRITSAALDNSAQGRVLAGRDQTVQATQTLGNQNGLISAGQAQRVTAQTLDNRGGELSARQRNTLSANQLDNQGGRLSAGQALDITVAGRLDNRAGALAAGQDLQLQAASVDNRNAGRIASDGQATARLGQFDQRGGGQLHGAKALTLDMADGHLDNSEGGLLTTPGQLTLQRLGTVNNQRGEISAGQAYALVARQLDNSSGKLLGGNDLQVRIAGQLANTAGLIAGHDLALNAATLLSQGGTLQARGGLQLQVAGQLDNSRGKLLAEQAFVLQAGSLVNLQGHIAGNGSLLLTSNGLDNRQGRISAAQGLTLDLSRGHWNNEGGTLQSPGALLLRNLATVGNRRGEISSQQGFSMAADSLDNQDGKLLSEQALTVRIAQALDNARGRIAAQALDVHASRLDNAAGELVSNAGLSARIDAELLNRAGLISAGGALSLVGAGLDNHTGKLLATGDIDLDLQALDNRAGQIKGAGRLAFTGQRLDNGDAGVLESTGAVTITSEVLVNRQAGQLRSGDLLVLKAKELDNSQGGRIASHKGLLAELGRLDQQAGGHLVSDGDLTLDLSLGALDNRGGLIHTPGQLVLRQLAGVDNRGGEISSARGFTLAAHSLDNGDGTLHSDQALKVLVEHALANAHGLFSATSLELRAASLANHGGTLGAERDLDLDVAGTVDNGEGEISSGGLTQVRAASLDNRGGEILGDVATHVNITGALDNRAGVLSTGQDLRVEAGSLDNSGRGSLTSDGALRVGTGALLNNREGGQIRAKGLIDLAFGRLDNHAGLVSGADLLTLRGTSVDNQQGTLHADRQLQSTVDSLDNRKGLLRGKEGLTFAGRYLDNREGLLTAGALLRLDASEVNNGKGRMASRDEVSADVRQLRQQGGEFVAEGRLTLRGDALDNSGGGLVSGNAGLDLQVADTDNRGGRLASLARVDIAGERLDNSEGGKVLAGTRLALVLDRLINQSKGLLFGQQVELHMAQLDNRGGTIGAGQHLQLGRSASGQGLGATLLDNRTGRLYSDGSLGLDGASLLNQQGTLSAKGDLRATVAQGLNNQGGRIETDASLVLASASVDNRNGGRLTAEADLNLDTGTLDNGQAGVVRSGERLQLTAGQVGNQATGSISARTLKASVTGLDQQGGELFSLQGLELDLNHGRLDNSGGLIRGPGPLVLRNLGEVVNQRGEISSLQAYTLLADSLDNTDGKLLGGEHLTVRIARQLDNLRGQVSARGLELSAAGLNNQGGLLGSLGGLQLQVGAALDNQGGTVQADGDLGLGAVTVLNAEGKLSAKGDLQARLGALDNRQGKVQAEGALALDADQVDNRAAGLLGATGALVLKAATLDNRGGEVNGKGSVTLIGQHLDNSTGGLLLAKGLLTLEQRVTLNQQGLIGAGSVHLRDVSLDNRGGELRGDTGQDLEVEGDLLNDQGRITSEGGLRLLGALLGNNAGLLSSAGDLWLESQGAVTNRGGQVIANARLDLAGASLDSRAGTISAKDELRIATGNLDNQEGGRLTSGASLNLDAARLDNSGGRITSQQALVANVTSLRQQGGTLYSAQRIELDLDHGELDNQQGLINTPGQLLLKRLARVDNRGGEISSASAFSLAATELDNGNGKLLGQQGLSLVVERALLNLKGQIAAAGVALKAASLANAGGHINSRGDLHLDVAGLLGNQAGGLVNARQLLDLNAANLDNQGGQVLTEQRLTVQAGQIDNSAKGLISSKDSLVLSTGQLRNDAGEISAKGALQVQATRLSQQGGRLLSEGSLALLFEGLAGDLDNRAGLIHGKGPLTLANLRDLDNRQGEISSAQGFNLGARALDNGAGRLISTGRLTLGADRLLNQGGLVSGSQGLEVNASSLDNRNGGTLSSREGDLTITLGAALDNSLGGALVSQGMLRVRAASLDNRGGFLASAAAQHLDLGNGTLDNRQGGRIDSGAAFSLRAAGLDNSGGTLVGLHTLTLDLAGQLSNVQGKLLSGADLQVRGTAVVLNQGGQLVSQAGLRLAGASLDNSDKGTLAANGDVQLDLTGAVLNDRDGLIHADAGSLVVHAARVSNQGGATQAKSAVTLTSLGALDNQGGKLIAQGGNLLLEADSVDNRGGVLASLQGLLDAKVGGLLGNAQNGIIQARQLKLIALGGLDNSGGRLAAQAGTLDVRTANLNNRGGGLFALGQLGIDAIDLDNGGNGQIAGQSVEFGLRGSLINTGGIIESDSHLGLSAASLNNQGGQLRTLGSAGGTRLQLTGALDNRGGVLEIANQDLSLQSAGFLNAGGRLLHGGAGTFDIGLANLGGAGGEIVTLGGLTLNAASWTNSSVIQAARLTVNVGELVQTGSGQLLASESLVGTGTNWSNEGLIASNGSLALALSGRYAAGGRATSLGALSLDAGSIDLASGGTLAGAGNVTLGGAGSLAALGNLGRVTAGQTLKINAGQLLNSGTLAGSGGLQLTASGITNQGGGLIFSGAAMQVATDNLNNTLADLYGIGDIAIGGLLPGSRATLIRNLSGQMQSLGNFSLNATQVVNERNNFNVNREVISSALGIRCYSCTGPRQYASTYSDPSHYVLLEEIRTSAPSGSDTVASNITAGKDLMVTGGRFSNSNSTVAATGNIQITVDTFENQGSAVGNYTSAKYLDAPVRTQEMYAYNRYNDAQYNYDFWFLNADGQASRLRPTSFSCCGPGREQRPWLRFGSVAIQVSAKSDIYYENYLAPSMYVPGIRTALPAGASGANVFAEKIIAGEAPTYLPAIIQAGGNVSITAATRLSNGVEQAWNAPGANARRTLDTGTAVTFTRTVVAPNRQLPPDLAQRQVNPLDLPGFSLPTSGNGLFRLSSQAASQASVSVADPAPASWTLGGASIDLQQRQQPLPQMQGRAVDIAALAPSSASERQLGERQRQGIDLDTRIDTVRVEAIAAGQGPQALPGRSELGAGHQATPVQVEAPRLASGSGGGATITQPAPVLPTVAAVSPSVAAGVSSRASAINPLSIPRVQGVPAATTGAQPHKYLIETDPVLTDLKQFMSSDYLLGNLGYDPDKSWKRLGDGFYEQRLIQQAVTARTGKRYIDGQTSDEALYRHLMDNALASKQQLNLSVGVSLTAAQVAALTHDIVWLEEHQVMGEKVLVPVLYLANANDRLAPNGALIEGKDVTLIAGTDLINPGTVRASNSLSASAGENLVNTGLIEAGGRVDLLAGNTLYNGAGGIIKGRDVNLSTLLGDVVNERTQSQEQGRYTTWATLDSAARIEASNDLSMSTGRDMVNVGGVLQAGRDLEIRTGRDLLIGSAEQSTQYRNGRQSSESITQFGSQVTAGRDLGMFAGHDFTAVGSELEAKRNITVDALNDLTLASAANEEHFYAKSKKVTRQEDHVRQVATDLKAGGDVSLTAGEDLRLISSRVSADDEAFLYAGDQLELLAETDSDYSLYQKKSKGSFGSKKTRRDEVTDVRHVGSEITSGGDLTLVSDGDQRYQVAKLTSGDDLTLESGGDITFEGVKDLHDESHEKSKSNAGWFSMKGKGRTDETLRQSELVATGDVAISAVGSIRADVRQVNQQTVRESIDAMVKADPKLAWLKELEAQGGVDWRQVQEVHTSFKYANSGLGPAAQMVIAILMTVMLGPAGAGLSGMQLAGAASLATTGAVGTINNNGDLGAGLKAVASKDGLTNAAIATITAGIADHYLGDMTMTKQVNGKTVVDLGSMEAIGHFAGQQLINNTSAALVAKAFGRDVTLAGILQSTIYNSLAAVSFDQVGNLNLKTGSPEKIALHALVGGFIAEASGSDFAVGAMAAGVNEAFANQLRRMATAMNPKQRDYLMLMSSQLLGVVVAAAVDGGNAGSLQAGSWVAGNATQYNNLSHNDMPDFVDDMNICGLDEGCQKKLWVANEHKLKSEENFEWAKETGGVVRARDLMGQIASGLADLEKLNCLTPTCTEFKELLTERAVLSLEKLADVSGQWAPMLNMIAMLPIGQRINGLRPPGVSGGVLDSPRVQAAIERMVQTKAGRVGGGEIKPATGTAALPTGYREGASAGAGFAHTAGLPEGYRRVINTKTGNVEVLATDGKLYLETAAGLKPKAGGNLAGLVDAEKRIAEEPTRFIDGVKVVDQKTGQVLQGTVDLGPTLERIRSGGSFPHRNDGSIFKNRGEDLPVKPLGYYTEYVHPTPGVPGPGPQRIVAGKGGEMYYTADHYKTFIQIKK